MGKFLDALRADIREILGELWERVGFLQRVGREAYKALQLCLPQSSLLNGQMREMEALESHNSLGEMRDKKALDFQGFSLSN